MAALHPVIWQNLGPTQTDTLAALCSRYQEVAGYPDASSFITAIRAQNPSVLDWGNCQDQTTLLLPFTA